MCGIFGLVIPNSESISNQRVEGILRQLFLFSESRGKESTGIHIYLPASKNSWTLKSPHPASRFIKLKEYKELIKKTNSQLNITKGPIAIIAHSRLVTNGRADDPNNNQPVNYDSVDVVHNGIIVNNDDLWGKNDGLKRRAEVDTEIIAALLSSKSNHDNKSPILATSEVYNQIKGSASIAWLSDNSDYLTLATNTGDLFYFVDKLQQVFCFASEKHILTEALKKTKYKNIDPIWLAPNTGMVLMLSNLHFQIFSLNATMHLKTPTFNNLRSSLNISSLESLLNYNAQNLAELKRCTTCILPQTFPFITFNKDGVCNYCQSYRPKYKNLNANIAKQEFIESLQKYRTNGKEPNVIVPFSGGRDSCYGLHLIKKEFGLNPVTFTYDWGMVTDLARRNIARLCGELGVQNILVSAEIKTKRKNIRRNIAAWLKKADLGMVPLFMAGDKHFFSIVNQLKKQTGIKLNLWSANPLENTDFKSGFCGVTPDFDKSRLDYLSATRKLKLISYFAGQFITNPSYLNSSIIDSLNSFISYYLESRRDFYFIFNHIIWNEDAVNETIINNYDFELSPDSPSSWRIGDGTAPFYNYIYITARGFSEFDTFRSNQIREGVITREYALEHVLKENYPRIESLRWYLDTLGLDFDRTIKTINKLDTLKLHS